MTLDRDLVRRAHELIDRAALISEAPGQRLDTSTSHTPATSRAPRSQGTSVHDQVVGILAPATTDDELRTAIQHADRLLRRHTHGPRASTRFERIAWDTIDERRRLARQLAGDGLSQRAIARRLGVDQATISRDLRTRDATAA